MIRPAALVALIVALVFDGILAGSGIDRGIVGLPGLRRLGVLAFARYGRAADLANGRVLYPLLAIGGALAELTVLVLTWLGHAPRELYASVGTAFVASVINLVLTMRAAPAMLAIGRTPDDEDLLRPLRDRSFLTRTRGSCSSVSSSPPSAGRWRRSRHGRETIACQADYLIRATAFCASCLLRSSSF